MKDKIRIVLCCIFLTIAVYAGYNIIKIQSEYKKGVDTYKEIDKYTIEQTVAQSSDNTEETVEETEEEKHESVLTGINGACKPVEALDSRRTGFHALQTDKQ